MHRKTNIGLVAAALLAGLLTATATGRSEEPAAAPQQSQSQDPGAAASAGVDYWYPDWVVRDLWGPGRMPKGMMVRFLRHTTFIERGVQPEYSGATPTVTAGPDTTAAGAKLYREHCTSCHGPKGMGNGDSAQALSPSPALLAFMIKRPISVDEYLLWTISEGGKEFDTAMPGFKDTLTRDEIWRIVAYMRAGFPSLPEK